MSAGRLGGRRRCERESEASGTSLEEFASEQVSEYASGSTQIVSKGNGDVGDDEFEPKGRRVRDQPSSYSEIGFD